MSKTKTQESDSELEQKLKAEKEASLMPQSAGRLLDEARKADTRSDADYQTSQAPDPTRVNIVKQLEDAQKEPEKAKEESLDDAEYERRTRLDVSHPNYINPSLGKK